MSTRRISWFKRISLLLLFVLFSGSRLTAQVYFFDDFENGLNKWIVSGQDWAIIDSDSRSATHSVTESPIGNYEANDNSTMLLANPVSLASSTEPVLTFWHKLGVWDNAIDVDHGIVELSEDGGTTWPVVLQDWTIITLSTWSFFQAELSEYKTSPILIRFRLRADGDTRVGDGWVIDDVEIKEKDTTTLPFPFSDDFENGLENWKSGPEWKLITDDFRSPNHAVTESASSNYIPNANSTLCLKNPIDLSGSVQPVLRFWHKLGVWDNAIDVDHGIVELSEDGGTTWPVVLQDWTIITLSTWSFFQADLSAYKTSPILLRFRLRADGDTRVGDGWVIDDVEIKEKDTTTLPFPFSDDFENGLSNWISGPEWEVTTDDFRSGSFSITESASSNYRPDANSTILLAHPIDLSGTTEPVLRFWYKLGVWDNAINVDHGIVELSEDGGTTWPVVLQDWTIITLSTWSFFQAELSEYKTSPILIRFRLRADGDTRVGDGWVLDDVEIKEKDTTTLSFPFSDDFENGLSNWISGPEWEVTTDDFRSGSFSITESASSNYRPDANSTILLAHPIDLSGTGQPRLRFWHKLDVWDNAINVDHGIVELSEDGGTTWPVVLSDWSITTFGWSFFQADLSAYKTSPILIRFRLRADGDTRVGDGWVIDDVEIFDIGGPSPPSGDVDSNGVVDSLDAVLILKHLVGEITLTPQQQTNADVSFDGTLSAWDASLIQQFAAGSIGSLPHNNVVEATGTITMTDMVVIGDQEEVALKLTNENNIYGFQLTVLYDPSDLEYQSAVWADAFKSFTPHVHNDSDSGIIRFAGADSLPVHDAPFLVLLNFRVKDISVIDTTLVTLESLRWNEGPVIDPDAESELITDVDEPGNRVGPGIPKKFSLHQNYPNPFNPTTLIRYELPKATDVRIDVYNVRGQRVAELMNGFMPAGVHELSFDASSLSTGVYLYRIQTSEFQQMRKMLLVK